jgi:hypothetical protein
MRGLQWFTTKPSGYLVEPQNQDRRLGGQRRIHAHRETSKRRTLVGIARLASGLSKVRSPGICPMVLQQEFPKMPFGGAYLTFM